MLADVQHFILLSDISITIFKPCA